MDRAKLGTMSRGGGTHFVDMNFALRQSTDLDVSIGCMQLLGQFSDFVPKHGTNHYLITQCLFETVTPETPYLLPLLLLLLYSPLLFVTNRLCGPCIKKKTTSTETTIVVGLKEKKELYFFRGFLSIVCPSF